MSGKAIDLNYARQLVQNYAKNKLNKPLLANDSQAVWFSKEIILTALGLDPATDTQNVTGLRFYFGAYEQKQGYPQNSFDYDKLTLVMVATGDSTVDIDRNGAAEVSYIDIIDEPDPAKKVQPSYPAAGTPVTGTSTYNDGQLRPPPKLDADLGLLNW